MKKIISLILATTMMLSLSATAFAVSEDNLNDYGTVESSLYEINGKKYVDIDGETFRYLSADDFQPVEDSDIIQMLDDSTSDAGERSSPYLPVPPTYSYNLSNGTYYGSVDLSNGDQWSPLIRRNTQMRYTNFRVDTIFNKTVSIAYFYYNALEEEWEGATITDMTFNVLLCIRQLQFGTMGDAAQGLRILFFDYDNSTQSFDYSLTDTNAPA